MQVLAANAGTARMASASSANTNESFLQQHVIELIAFLLLRRNRALVGCCL
jgi:hypothetical protein